MVLGSFLLLCECDPDEVYGFFMEYFIDAYDWVMVPNVYGMSQFADGGMMSTKPYLSASHYLLKMGDWKKGKWERVWDGLFWRFLSVHRGFFSVQPRWRVLLGQWDRMPDELRQEHLRQAQIFLENGCRLSADKATDNGAAAGTLF
jgi:deoxyribodipyrimidine photolyase-related protein